MCVSKIRIHLKSDTQQVLCVQLLFSKKKSKKKRTRHQVQLEKSRGNAVRKGDGLLSYFLHLSHIKFLKFDFLLKIRKFEAIESYLKF